MSFQPDISSQKNAKRGKQTPFHVAYRNEELLAKHRQNSVTRVRNTIYCIPFQRVGVLGFNVFQPRLLVPANPNRIALTIAGVMIHGLLGGFRAFYSFGYPVKTHRDCGIPMPGYELQNLLDVVAPRQAAKAPRNGVISVDDIYVTLGNYGAINNSDRIMITAFEGVLSTTGNELAA